MTQFREAWASLRLFEDLYGYSCCLGEVRGLESGVRLSALHTGRMPDGPCTWTWTMMFCLRWPSGRRGPGGSRRAACCCGTRHLEPEPPRLAQSSSSICGTSGAGGG